MQLSEAAGGVDAVQERHGDVDHGDVGPQLFGRFEQRVSVRHGAHHLAMFREQLLERVEQQRVVVGEQHPRATHLGIDSRPDACRSTFTVIRVPWPGAVSTKSLPPTERTRSSMLMSPTPRGADAANPAPASATRTKILRPSPARCTSVSMTPLCCTTFSRAS